MKTSEFAKELTAMDSNLTVIPNPNNEGLSNVMYMGRDVCPIPSGEIREESDPSYSFTFQNGMIARHKSRQEALAQVRNVLELVKTEEGREIFFDK